MLRSGDLPALKGILPSLLPSVEAILLIVKTLGSTWRYFLPVVHEVLVKKIVMSMGSWQVDLFTPWE
jgi:hypothetical protein